MEAILGEYPGAIENTKKIADRCHVTLTFGDHKLPSFDVPEGETSTTYLRKLCEKALPERYPHPSGKERERLDYELGVIDHMGFSDYFLIVMDFIHYAKSHGIPIGPGAAVRQEALWPISSILRKSIRSVLTFSSNVS